MTASGACECRSAQTDSNAWRLPWMSEMTASFTSRSFQRSRFDFLIGSAAMGGRMACTALLATLDADDQQEVIDPHGQFGRCLLEGAPARFSARHRRRIGEAPMDLLGVAGKGGAGLAGDVAGRNDGVEVLVQEWR